MTSQQLADAMFANIGKAYQANPATTRNTLQRLHTFVVQETSATFTTPDGPVVLAPAEIAALLQRCEDARMYEGHGPDAFRKWINLR